MKRILSSIIIVLIFLIKGYTQTDKSNIQVGASILPIFDLFNLFPDNKINGGALTGNLGFFVINNLGFGINPYYAQVTNKYTSEYNSHKERQDILIFGLNTYIRYYVIKKEKLLIYAIASGGFGNIDKKTTDLSTSTSVVSSHSNKSILTFLTGFGFNYFIKKNISLELNLPCIFLKYISLGTYDDNFQTLTPTIGLQYYWK